MINIIPYVILSIIVVFGGSIEAVKLVNCIKNQTHVTKCQYCCGDNCHSRHCCFADSPNHINFEECDKYPNRNITHFSSSRRPHYLLTNRHYSGLNQNVVYICITIFLLTIVAIFSKYYITSCRNNGRLRREDLLRQIPQDSHIYHINDFPPTYEEVMRQKSDESVI